MLVGVAVFVAPTWLTQVLILFGALGTSVALPFLQDTMPQLIVRLILAAALVISGVIAVIALGRGGLPKEDGAPSDPEALRRKLWGILPAEWAVYLGILIVVPLIAVVVQRGQIAGALLSIMGLVALAYIAYEALFRCNKIESERVCVALILMFFSMLFWAFFEQAGSSVNNFTDRNIDRVLETRILTDEDVDTTIRFRVAPMADDPAIAKLPLLSQEQLGYKLGDEVFTMTTLTDLRDTLTKQQQSEGESDREASAEANVEDEIAEDDEPAQEIVEWPVTEEHVGMGVGNSEIPASEFQAANPLFILLFGLVFSGLWAFLDRLGWEPSTPVKFALGLMQLGLAFVMFWYGAQVCNDRGMVGMSWLLVGYLLQTTGELCLSPVGLAMITKLSPTRIVSTIMGAWFLATAFSNFLAGLIARFTGVSHGGDGKQVIPAPIETVHLYGDVFGKIALAAIASGVVCLLMAPLLSRWMHPEADDEGNPLPEVEV